MYDSSDLLTKFYCDHIRLTTAQQNEMRDRRNLNRDRIKAGLADLEKPKIVETINQGGYAMKTMTQPPEASDYLYDIDLGLVFEEADVAAPKTTRGWVKNALNLKATQIKNDAEDTGKCVRIEYSAGYQCDFPVFRRTPSFDSFTYQIALRDEWVLSSPQQINDWFERTDKTLSPPTDVHQFRRVVTVIKYIAKVWAVASRLKYPSGLLVTAIAAECYRAIAGRLDQSVYLTLQAISFRSEHLRVSADGIQISNDDDVQRIKRFIDKCSQLVRTLEPLENTPGNVTPDEAKKLWKKVFRHSYFEVQDVSKASTGGSGVGKFGLGAAVFSDRAAAAVASTPVITKPFAQPDEN